MNINESTYLDALKKVKKYGKESSDRTGTGTIRYPGLSMRFDLSKGFPATTTKKLLFYPMVIELLWFLQGRTDLKWLQDRNCNIWNSWHDSNNTIGKGYGHQWRNWQTTAILSKDQIKEVIENIKNDQNSRRHIVTAWNVAQIDQMVLPPCHHTFQFVVIDGVLNCILSQRSGDMFLGVPFNIASYSLLIHMFAIECNLIPGTLIHNIGDAHIYKNHFNQVEEQLSRKPYTAPELTMDDNLFSNKGLLHWIDNECKHLSRDEIKALFKLKNYEHQGMIKAPVAV